MTGSNLLSTTAFVPRFARLNTRQARRVNYHEINNRFNRIKLMKTQILKRLSSGFALAILPLVGGCTQQADDAPLSLVSTAQAEPVIEAGTEAIALDTTGPTEVGGGPPPPENVLSPSINPSSALAEVVKLAQSGVDESVLYAFITNSTSIFGLGSDQIIYLNDLGLSGPLVTTMIEHDQEVKQYWANRAQAQAALAVATNSAPAPENAAGPAYINPPQPEPAPQPQPVEVSNNYFYDTLSPYGSWVNVDGYGLCWRPTVAVVNPGWQPYADRGRWVYSDAGWYWLSDYSWGATAFHYGRWFNQPNVGWCWWPDRVWGPSWVSWRYSSGYCGWAPLPPAACYRPGVGFTYYGNSVGVSFAFGLSANCYTFVPTAYFCSPRPYNHRVPGHQRTAVYNQTVVANNYIVGNNNTVVNGGIPVAQVAATTGTPIRPVPIREAGTSFRHGGRGERLEQGGRAITVHRPNLPPTKEAAVTTIAAAGPTQSPTVQPGTLPRGNNSGTALNGSRSGPRAQAGFASRHGQSGGNTVTAPIAGTPAQVTTAPVPQQPLVTRPDSRSDRNNLRANNPRSDQRHNPGTAPLIIRGGNFAAQSTVTTTPATTPSAPVAPASSLVVIGGREGNNPPARSPYGRSSSRARSTTPNTAQPITATPSQASATPVVTAPSSGPIVIGNRDGNASQSRNVFARSSSRDRYGRPTTSAPTSQAAPSSGQFAAAPVITTPTAARTAPSQFNYSPASPYQHQQSQRSARSYANRSAPTTTYSAPTPAQRQSAPPNPGYSAPVSSAPVVAQSAPPQTSSRGLGYQRSSNDARRDR